MVNRARVGRYYEHKSKALLEKQGYHVTRSAASQGLFDLIAANELDVLLIQVKTRDWPYGEEMKALRAFKVPPCCKKIIHRWRKGQREPDVKEVD